MLLIIGAKLGAGGMNEKNIKFLAVRLPAQMVEPESYQIG